MGSEKKRYAKFFKFHGEGSGMFKKVLIGTGAGVVVLGLLFGRDAVSIVSTAASQVSQTARNAMSVDFEIDRAHAMIKDLDPEIRRNMHLIAKEEVEVERLESEVERTRLQLADSRENIMRLKSDLDSDAGSYYYGGRRYTVTQVKTDLSNRFERHKTKEGTLEKLEKILQARRSSLDAARQKLEGMMAAKRQLEVDVANLQARQKMVEVAQTTSDINFDDSHLARTKELINAISTRIDVAERMVNADVHFQDEIPLDAQEATDEDLADEITAYFGDDEADQPARLAAHAE